MGGFSNCPRINNDPKWCRALVNDGVPRYPGTSLVYDSVQCYVLSMYSYTVLHYGCLYCYTVMKCLFSVLQCVPFPPDSVTRHSFPLRHSRYLLKQFAFFQARVPKLS